MSPPIKNQRISQSRLLATIASYLPEIIATSLFGREQCARINSEMVVILSRTDPDRISIKLRDEQTINCFDVSPPVPVTGIVSALESDKLEVFVNNALVKIDREVVIPLLTDFYSSQKMTTIDAMIRFKSGVIGSITIKKEISGY